MRLAITFSACSQLSQQFYELQWYKMIYMFLANIILIDLVGKIKAEMFQSKIVLFYERLNSNL